MTVEPGVTVPVEPDHHMLCAVLAKFPKLASMEMVRKIYAVMLSTAAPPPAPDADAVEIAQEVATQIGDKLHEETGYTMEDQLYAVAYPLIAAALTSHASRQVAALEAENFALAANQCHEGYAGEHGDHMCRIEDRLKAAERQVAEAVAAERERCAKIHDVQAEQFEKKRAALHRDDYWHNWYGNFASNHRHYAAAIRAGDKGGAG